MSLLNYDKPPVRCCQLCGEALELRYGKLSRKYFFSHGTSAKGAWDCRNRKDLRPVFFETHPEAYAAEVFFQ